MCYEMPTPNKKGLTEYLVRVNFNCRRPVFFFIAQAMWLGKMGKFISPAYENQWKSFPKKHTPELKKMLLPKELNEQAVFIAKCLATTPFKSNQEVFNFMKDLEIDWLLSEELEEECDRATESQKICRHDFWLGKMSNLLTEMENKNTINVNKKVETKQPPKAPKAAPATSTRIYSGRSNGNPINVRTALRY